MPPKNKPKNKILCLCNNITEQKVIEAIQNRADTCDKIYDMTGAGVGPCGGTCRTKTKKLIHNILKESLTKTKT